MSWRMTVSHDGLGKVRVVTAGDRDLLHARANALQATWDAEYARRLETQRAAKAKVNEKLEKFMSKNQAEAEARQRTADLQAELESLETLLKSTIEFDYVRNWEEMKRSDVFSKPHPTKSSPATLPVPAQPEYRAPQFTFFERLLPTLARKRQAAHDRAHDSALERWQDSVTVITARNDATLQANEEKYRATLEEYIREKEAFERGQNQSNADVETEYSLYLQRDPDTLIAYWNDLFSNQANPEGWPDNVQLDFIQETHTLVINYQLPHIDQFPRNKEIRYVATRKEFKEFTIPDSQRKKIYGEVLYQIALASLFKVFHSDSVGALQAAVLNGWVQSIDKATGASIQPCILTLHTTKDEFLALNMAQVEPRACFKKLKGVSGARLHDISPVQPVIPMDRNDRRFVDSYSVVESLNEATNLAAMDWLDFENLIRELFEKEFSGHGGEVKITQASRDGGVDAIAFDPDPIRGGKIVIQAKRYTNVVGVSAVRDLYGTVHNEGATKGILVTTADFGPDAYEFAKGKPLTLLSGGELLYLLQRHGYKARIDMREAKQIINQANNR